MTELPDRTPTAQPPARPAVQIDRCVCLNRRFVDLLSLARASGFGLADLMRATGCGEQCGLCRPYLRRMLSTGETVFHQILESGAE
jgi:bacterioferritin-associated ferredoxin